jgi:RNA polymerase sigma factor (sigma-70 family)
VEVGRRIRGLLERLLGSRRNEIASEGATDSELLRHFAVVGDQEAFELLVWRHGVMVLGLCQRLIHDEHLAEDAFQAVFLVLAKKAWAIHSRNVAGWLYRVARRVAARAERSRGQMRELPIVAAEQTANPVERDEISHLLDIEIARLPERLRQPVLMCCLGGRSTEEAARELGCPRGTILSRLSAARKRLAECLIRRGVTLPAVLPVVGLGLNGRLVSGTLAAIPRFLAGNAPLDPVSLLAQGVIQTMKYSKLMTFVGAMLAMGFVSGIGWVAAQSNSGGRATNDPLAQNEPKPNSQASKPEGTVVEQVQIGFVRAEQPASDPIPETGFAEILKFDPAIANALKPDPNDTPLRKLQKERCVARSIYLAKILTLIDFGKLNGKWNPLDSTEVVPVPGLLSNNLMELMEKPEDKIKCFEFRIAFLKNIEKFTDFRVQVGTDPSQNRDIIIAARIDAEIDLLKFKAQIDKLKK